MAHDLADRLKKLVALWVDRFAEHDLLAYASAIAFQVLKSLIPLTLLGISLLELLGRRDIWNAHIAPALRTRFDPPVFRAIDFAVQKIFTHSSVGLVIFAALLTVWYVSGGVRAIMDGINHVYDVDETRPFWIRWPISFGLALCVVGALVGAILLVEAVPTPDDAWKVPVVGVRWLGAVAALAVATAVLVRLGPVEPRSKRWASAGALVVVATWIATSLVFRWFVASLANFKTAVGQLTVFIVLLVYVYASSIVLLVGVEVDELLRENANADEQGILHVLFGIRH